MRLSHASSTMGFWNLQDRLLHIGYAFASQAPSAGLHRSVVVLPRDPLHLCLEHAAEAGESCQAILESSICTFKLFSLGWSLQCYISGTHVHQSQSCPEILSPAKQSSSPGSFANPLQLGTSVRPMPCVWWTRWHAVSLMASESCNVIVSGWRKHVSHHISGACGRITSGI